MKIVVRNSDNLVFFIGKNLILNSLGAYGHGWKANYLNDTNSRIEEIDTVPDNFISKGWTYVDGVWEITTYGTEHLNELNRKAIPQSVTIRQAKLALSTSNLLTTVNTFIATQSEEVQIYWENSILIERNHPIVLLVQVDLNLTDTELDNLFILANGYES